MPLPLTAQQTHGPAAHRPYLFTGRSSAPSLYMLLLPSYTWSVDRCTSAGRLRQARGKQRLTAHACWREQEGGREGAQPQHASLVSSAPLPYLPCRAAWLSSAASSCVGMLMARAAASPSPSQAAGAAWAAQLMTLRR